MRTRRSEAVDMTRGSAPRLLARFAAPIFVGYACQQLYQVADAAVVGRLIGVEAFAAVGATSTLCWLFLCVILGVTQGFGALLAQRFGAGDRAGFQRTLYNAGLLAAAFALVETACGLVFARAILIALRTPGAILQTAHEYLRMYLAGVPCVMFYNLAASALRAVGDSKTPLIAVMLSSALNIALDVLAVSVLKMGVSGVALATVLSQFAALLYCAGKLRAIDGVFPRKPARRRDARSMRALCRLGAPGALRNVAIAAGGLMILPVINDYGTLFVAGLSASIRYFGLMEMLGGALESAVATFVGQNVGAGLQARARQGVKWAALCGLIGACCLTAIILLFGRQLIEVLVAGAREDIAHVTEYGFNHLAGMAVCLPALYMLFVFRAALQSMGRPLAPLLSGFTEMALKLVSVYLLSGALGAWSVYLAESFGWIGAAALLAAAYLRAVKKS